MDGRFGKGWACRGVLALLVCLSNPVAAQTTLWFDAPDRCEVGETLTVRLFLTVDGPAIDLESWVVDFCHDPSQLQLDDIESGPAFDDTVCPPLDSFTTETFPAGFKASGQYLASSCPLEPGCYEIARARYTCLADGDPREWLCYCDTLVGSGIPVAGSNTFYSDTESVEPVLRCERYCCEPTVEVLLDGTVDDFVGPEPSNFCNPFQPNPVDFDSPTALQEFCHEIKGVCAGAVEAELEVRLRPLPGSATLDDEIRLGFSIFAPQWIRKLGPSGVDPGLQPSVWESGSISDFTFTLDLNDLPELGGTSLSLIDALALAERLQIQVSAGTSVDFVKLTTTCCDLCAPVLIEDCCLDLVFLLDTSASVLPEVEDFCDEIDSILADLTASGINIVNSQIYVIDGSPPPALCQDGVVSTDFPSTVDNIEDWGPAIVAVANNYPWSSNCTRMIVPITDEGPQDGGTFLDAADDVALLNATNAALSSSVVVAPICPNASPTVVAAAQQISTATGGFTTFLSTELNPENYRRHLSQRCCLDVPTGLVAWWTFDELVGDTSHDGVGGNHGDHRNALGTGGPTPVPGQIDAALAFNGNGDFVLVPDNPNESLELNDEFTVDVWVRRDAANETMTILDKRTVSPERGYWIFLQDGFVSIRLSNGPSTEVISDAFVPLDENWHLIAVTCEPAGTLLDLRFYVDGDRQDRELIGATIISDNANSADLLIGWSDPNLCDGALNGCLDELEIFNRALTQYEICALFQFPKCKEVKEEFCPGNLIANGSFECGISPACPLSTGFTLGGIFDWYGGGGDLTPRWVGETGDDCCSSDEDDYFFGDCFAAHGTRFVALQVENLCKHNNAADSEIAIDLEEPLEVGVRYCLSYYARTFDCLSPVDPFPSLVPLDIYCGVDRGRLCVTIDNELLPCGDAVQSTLDPNGLPYIRRINGCRSLTGAPRTWSEYRCTFVAQPTHTGSTLRFTALPQGPGVLLDAVCLRRCTPEELTYEWGLEDWIWPSGFGVTGPGLLTQRIGSPTLVVGQLGLSALLDGQEDAFTVEDNAVLAVGTQDFSIVVAVAPSLLLDYQPLLDKRDVNGQGFLLYLDEGRLAIRLGDENGAQNYVANTAPLPLGTWSHVAVTVRRDNPEEGLSLFVEGERVASFDPTSVPGSLSSSAPLEIGRGRALEGGPIDRFFAGGVDEVGVYSVKLEPGAVAELAIQGSLAAPREFVTLPEVDLVSSPGELVVSTMIVTNQTRQPQSYDWSAEALPGEGFSDAVTGLSFAQSFGSLAVPAESSVTLPLEIVAPANLDAQSSAYYRVRLINSTTGVEHESIGRLRLSTVWSVEADEALHQFEEDENGAVNFSVTNLTDVARAFDYRLLSTVTLGGLDAIVMINGIVPEIQVPGFVLVEPLETVTIQVTVRVIDHTPHLLHELVLLIESDLEGQIAPLASTAIQTFESDCLIPPPAFLSCQDQSCVAVTLDWVNFVDYDAIELRRDGFVIQTLGGSATNAIDSQPVSGTTVYTVVGIAGQETCSATCSVTLGCEPLLIRGDCTQDFSVNLADAINILTALFSGAELGSCEDACDTNDDGGISISDAVYLLGALFNQGPLPPEPHPSCGVDPTSDGLECVDSICP